MPLWLPLALQGASTLAGILAAQNRPSEEEIFSQRIARAADILSNTASGELLDAELSADRQTGRAKQSAARVANMRGVTGEGLFSAPTESRIMENLRLSQEAIKRRKSSALQNLALKELDAPIDEGPNVWDYFQAFSSGAGQLTGQIYLSDMMKETNMSLTDNYFNNMMQVFKSVGGQNSLDGQANRLNDVDTKYLGREERGRAQ